MKRVDQYINNQPSPQQEILQYLRQLIQQTLPHIKETYKNGVPWYEDKFYLVGLKDSVNLGFAVQGLRVSEMKQFTGKGKYMRHLKFKTLKEIDPSRIKHYLKLVYTKTTPHHS